MSQSEQFEVLVLGSGTGGKLIAWHMAQSGRRALGLVDSLNHPGGNLTGIYFFTQGLEGKRLGLLHELVPTATTIAALVNPDYSPAKNELQDAQEAAARLGVQVLALRANTEADFDAVFADLDRQRAGALLVCASPFFFSRRQQLVVLAARHAVPAIYEWREFAADGGLMSYGTNINDAYRQMRLCWSYPQGRKAC